MTDRGDDSTPASSGPERVPAADGLLLRTGERIPSSELSWRFSASGGPGGQHVNTSNTRAEVRFDIASSASLSESTRERLTRRFGPEVVAVASDRRSQSRNRTLALERLRTRLDEALHRQRPRRPTKPTAGSKRRRLDAKRRRSEIKRNRRGPSDHD